MPIPAPTEIIVNIVLADANKIEEQLGDVLEALANQLAERIAQAGTPINIAVRSAVGR